MYTHTHSRDDNQTLNYHNYSRFMTLVYLIFSLYIYTCLHCYKFVVNSLRIHPLIASKLHNNQFAYNRVSRRLHPGNIHPSNSEIYENGDISANNDDNSANDVENDDKEDDEFDSNNVIVDTLRKVYDSIFFYGIDNIVPQNNAKSRNSRRKPIKQGIESLFFTRSELIGIQQDRSHSTTSTRMNSEYDDENNAMSIGERLDAVTRLLNELQDDLELIEATLLTLPEISGKDDVQITRKQLIKKRLKLQESIERLKIEYVNLIAEFQD